MASKPKPKAKPKSAQTKQIEYIRQHYGFLAGFLDIPEIRSILLRASNPDKPWSPARLQGEVYKTKWWKTTAQVTRSWVALQATDPATAKQQLKAASVQIQAAAKAAGVAVTDKQVQAWALNVNKFGWTPQQVQSAIGHQFAYNPDKAAQGQAGMAVDQLKETAAQYLVPVSDATLQKWAQNVVGGDVDLAAFEAYAKEQAKSLFPGLAPALDAGVTVKQYVEPYAEVAAQTLEIAPDQVNWMDAKWNRALQQIDPKTGVRTSMSLSDWQKTLRTDSQYGYDTTKQARAEAATLTSKLGEMFGVL